MALMCYEQELLFGNNAMAGIKRKALARLMSKAGVEKEKVSAVIGVSVRQIYHYAQGGAGEDYTDNRYCPVSALEGYAQKIVSELVTYPPATAKEAAARIHAITGLKRSPTQVRAFMHKHGAYSNKLEHLI